MSETDPARASGEPEADRRHDGTGQSAPLHGSEAQRGNEPPDATAPEVTHVERSIAGADGPIRIIEESGAAAGDIMRDEAAGEA